MKAKSIKGKNAEEIIFALNDAMVDGFKPTLALVLLNHEKDVQPLCEYLSEKQIKVIGSSTGGNFIDGEVQYESIAVLLLDILQEQFKIEFRATEAGTTKEKAEQIAKAGLDTFHRPAFLILSGGLTADGEEIVDGIESLTGKGTAIFGGLASDNLRVERTFVFTNDHLTDLGLVVLILDGEKIDLQGIAVGGWKPVGIDRIITKSKGNTVYTIDNEPALEFIKRYSGLKQIDVDNAINFVLASNFQVELIREGKHSVMRTPMWYNKEDGSIIFAGTMPEGSKVRLALLPGFEVVDATLEEFKKFQQGQPKPDATILFSCAGRELSLGPYAVDEVKNVNDIWHVPMIGFYCYGEIGRVISGSHEFHNMTCSLATIKEK